jgi:hypothetical protein
MNTPSCKKRSNSKAIKRVVVKSSEISTSAKKQLKISSLSVLIAASLSACSEGSDTPGLIDNPQASAVNDASELTDTNAQSTENVDAVNGRNRQTRSPQGIPDDGNDRRNNARGPRGNGQRPERVVDNGMEIRTYDGSSNNELNIEWGQTFSNLQRLGDAAYSDGTSSMIFTDKAGPREISNTIVSQAPGENILNTFGTSDYLWQWGQFIDHDLDLTDGSADEPMDIPVPTGDPWFDPNGTGTAVIPFNRALYDPDTGTDSINVRQQENEITSWIDGSMVYGSDSERAAALRESDGSAFLATSSDDMLPFNTDELTNANGPVPEPASLFLAGDIRANEQVGLAAMHTLFVREHNRLARLLAEENPEASGETIFQAARRLVIAQIQVITYREFLPALLGENAIPTYQGYDASINPTIYNEFSAAAFRLGHSMVSDQILRIGDDGRPVNEGPLTLAAAFFTAPQVLQDSDDLEAVLRGLSYQQHQAIDNNVIHTLRNLLFGAPGSGGLDLTALNIQRGRDHGLPSYNDMRIALGLSPYTSFEQITTDIGLQQSLRDAYGDVSKIDLWVGGLAETPLSNQGSQLGELFHAIIVKQFTDLRDGDRFWYESHLTNNELNRIENVSLAQIIRNNTGIANEISDNVFYAR